MTVKEFNNENEFNNALKNNTYLIVDFSATWCAPCKKIAPKYDELSSKYSHVFFGKIDVDEVEEVSQTYNVNCMPTFILFKSGKEIKRLEGANVNELTNLLNLTK